MILIPKGKPIKVQLNTQHNKVKPNYRSTSVKKYKTSNEIISQNLHHRSAQSHFLFAFFPPCVTDHSVVLVYSVDNRRQEYISSNRRGQNCTAVSYYLYIPLTEKFRGTTQSQKQPRLSQMKDFQKDYMEERGKSKHTTIFWCFIL